MKDLISIILPTRKRFEYLQLSIDSLLKTSANKGSVEIMCLFDDDDSETIERYSSWAKDFQHKELIVPRLGYAGMHRYNNMLCEASSGNWLFLWNDDSRMVSPGWDNVIINEYRGQFVMLSPMNLNNVEYTREHCMFPILPRKWFEVTGRLSPWQQTDTYLNRIAKPLNLFRFEDRIQHEHGEVNTQGDNRIHDETTREIAYKSDLPTAEVKKDIRKIKRHLADRRLAGMKHATTLPGRWLNYLKSRF